MGHERIQLVSTSTSEVDKMKSKRCRNEIALAVQEITHHLRKDEMLMGVLRVKIGAANKGFQLSFKAKSAPNLSIGITDSRLILQYSLNRGDVLDCPPEMSIPLEMIRSFRIDEIETFGGEETCRIVISPFFKKQMRYRVYGKQNCRSAREMARVFTTLTSPRECAEQLISECKRCEHALNGIFKCCPYCGAQQSAAGVN